MYCRTPATPGIDRLRRHASSRLRLGFAPWRKGDDEGKAQRARKCRIAAIFRGAISRQSFSSVRCPLGQDRALILPSETRRSLGAGDGRPFTKRKATFLAARCSKCPAPDCVIIHQTKRRSSRRERDRPESDHVFSEDTEPFPLTRPARELHRIVSRGKRRRLRVALCAGERAMPLFRLTDDMARRPAGR